MIKKFCLLFFTLLFLSSCNELGTSVDGAKGEVEFSLITDAINEVKSASSNLPSVSDFRVELINSKNVIFKRWEKFSDVQGLKVPMNIGNYKIRATYGDTTATGFGLSVFAGEQDFVVQGQTSSVVSVVCKTGNVKTEVNYGPNLMQDFDSYRAEIWNITSDDKLPFSKDETRAGFVPAGKIAFRLYVINSENKEVSYTTDPVEYYAADYVKFNVDTKEAPSGNLSISITIDSSTNDEDVVVEIPALMLPKPAPSFVFDGFSAAAGNTEVLIEGQTPSEATVNINTVVGIKSCKLNVNAPQLVAMGWPEQIDFFNMSASTISVLEASGLEWTSDMDELKIAQINFTEVLNKMKYNDDGSANCNFNLVVTDTLDQESNVDFAVIVTKADITLLDIPAYDAWAKKVYLSTVSSGNPNNIKIEYSINNIVWNEFSGSPVVTGSNARFEITGLAANTLYYFRAKYNNATTDAKSVTTETALNVGNNGFEEWTKGNVVAYSIFGSKTYQEVYYPWASADTKWWDTNNKQTTEKSGTPAYLTFKCFPTTSYIAGRTGGNAAQIMALAINDANTKSTSLSDAKPGYMFIGTMNSSSSRTQGHSFASRPSAMEFYYKYDTHGHQDEFRATIRLYNGSTLIGTGEFKKSQKGSVGWTKATTNITYSVTNKKATSIQIEFWQSTDSTPPYKMNVSVTMPNGKKDTHAGSILTLDDITLIY